MISILQQHFTGALYTFYFCTMGSISFTVGKEDKRMDFTLRSCVQSAPALTLEVQNTFIDELEGWKIITSPQGRVLTKSFQCSGVEQCARMEEEIKQLADKEDHHPSLTLDGKVIIVSLSTHSVGGLTENDFILAAKIDQLCTQ